MRRPEVVLIDREVPASVERHRIDVWWRGHRNGSLMVILAYLMTLNWAWSGATIRMLRVVKDTDNVDEARRELFDLADASRIPMEIQIVSATGEPFSELLAAQSRDSDLVLLGFQPPSAQDADRFHAHYSELVRELPTTLLVSSSGEADLLA